MAARCRRCRASWALRPGRSSGMASITAAGDRFRRRLCREWCCRHARRVLLPPGRSLPDHFHQFGCGSDILAVGYPLDDCIDRAVAGHAVDLRAVTEAETEPLGLHVAVTGQQ